jgi:hypothetical protein
VSDEDRIMGSVPSLVYWQVCQASVTSTLAAAVIWASLRLSCADMLAS